MTKHEEKQFEDASNDLELKLVTELDLWMHEQHELHPAWPKEIMTGVALVAVARFFAGGIGVLKKDGEDNEIARGIFQSVTGNVRRILKAAGL